MYKRGSNVRIDTTLLGFDHTTWQRGNRTYIFKGDGKTSKIIQNQNGQWVLIKCFILFILFFLSVNELLKELVRQTAIPKQIE